MTKHTPGPWTFDRDWARVPTIHGAGGLRIGTVDKSRAVAGGRVYPIPDEERCANASLLAAAPDLVIALRAMCDMYTEMVNSGDCRFWDPEQVDEMRLARAALAKATA